MFCNRKPLSLPRYRFWVRFSVDTTSAVLLGFAARMFFTSSTEIMPAEHPWQNMMQARTIVSKWWTTCIIGEQVDTNVVTEKHTFVK